MKKGKMVLIAAGAFLLGACQEKNAEIQDSQVMPGPALSEETQSVMSEEETENVDEGGVPGEFAAEELTGEESAAAEAARENTDASAQEKSWQQIYLEYFEEKQREMDESRRERGLESADFLALYTYSLIYVNDDEIPELVMDSGVSAGGTLILTCGNGQVDEWMALRCNFDYIERGNQIHNPGGLMGTYYDRIAAIENSVWTDVAEGNYGEPPEGTMLDEEGELVYEYFWEGESVTEQEYAERLNAAYDTEKAVYPERWYIGEELVSILRTGATLSVGHRYELAVEDGSWSQAEERCREKGGSLAAITCFEELERIQTQIESENKTDVVFQVGARRGWSGIYWNGFEDSFGHARVNLGQAFDDFWAEDEPSYEVQTETGEEIDEDYVYLYYDSGEGRCFIFDGPNDILEVYPSLKGRLGYICEYES